MRDHVHHRHGPDDCFGCRIKGIQFSPTATPSRSPDVQAKHDMEARLEKDLPAYKQLRKEGLQPQTTKGAHDLMMRATSRHDIEGTPEGWEHRAEVLSDKLPDRP